MWEYELNYSSMVPDAKNASTDMNKYKSILILIAVILVAVGIVSFQYRFYRTPVALTTTPSIEDQIVSGGPPMSGIPAIEDPQFESVSAADQYLDDHGSGLFVERLGRVRFYPFQLLVWHLIVNETFSGSPLLVTYDPLSETAHVFERIIGDQTITFSVSGKLYNSNMLMSDSLGDSLWSQALGQAIVGEKRGENLKRVESQITTWKQFKRLYPNGQVLSRETGFTRDYTHNPYASYHSSHAVWFPVSHHDDRLDVKTLVFGYENGSAQKAYPKEVVREKGTIEDEVGGKRIVIYWDPEFETVRGYTAIDEHEIIMQPSYWFSWAAMHPQTFLY